MPGTPEEYAANPETAEAEGLIDAAIAEGVTSGSEIVSRLESSGFRVYPQADAPADALGEGMMDEVAPEAEGEPEIPLHEMMDEFAMGEGEGEMPMPPPEPGRQDVILEAVRFGIDEDKKKKATKDSE